MISSDLETKNDPSIAELGEQLDAFVASIQARLQDVVEMDMPNVTRPSRESSNSQDGPTNRLSLVKQRMGEGLEFGNGS